VFSTISSTEEYVPTILGSFRLWRKEGLEAVEADEKHITMGKVYGLQCVLKNELKV
jgi:hypothetical protein